MAMFNGYKSAFGISRFPPLRMICTRETTYILACFVKVSITLLMVMKRDCVDSAIIQFPSDTMELVNESTYFNCSTSIRPFDEQNIIWFHFPLDAGGDRRYIYDDGRIMSDYRNRFTIETDVSSGAVNLLALRLELKDAGRYECRDDIQEGEGASAELTVLAGALTCQTNFIRDEHSCGLDPDEVQLSCSVTFHGNIHHQLEWKKAGESSSNANQTTWTSSNNKIITSSAALKTDLSINNQLYVCSTKASIDSRFRCYSETIRLQYAFGSNVRLNTTIDEEIKCSANSSQPCSYKWLWINRSDSLTVSTDQTLKPTRVGSHRCEATCDIGNKSCTVDVIFAEVSIADVSSSEASSGENTSFLWLGLVVLLVIAIIAIIVVICLKRRKADKRPPVSIMVNLDEQYAM